MHTTPEFDQEARKAALEIARAAVVAAASGGEPEAPDRDAVHQALHTNAGAFVSLHRRGSLRGCVGTFDTTQPLWSVIQSMGVAASTRDTRFPPVTHEEIAELSVSISVLTPPRPIERLDEIEPGRHGLVVARGYRRGVLLAKVAIDRGWTREEFLSATCMKAGLAANTWREFGREPTLEIHVFEEFDFGEPRRSR